MNRVCVALVENCGAFRVPGTLALNCISLVQRFLVYSVPNQKAIVSATTTSRGLETVYYVVGEWNTIIIVEPSRCTTNNRLPLCGLRGEEATV